MPLFEHMCFNNKTSLCKVERQSVNRKRKSLYGWGVNIKDITYHDASWVCKTAFKHCGKILEYK